MDLHRTTDPLASHAAPVAFVAEISGAGVSAPGAVRAAVATASASLAATALGTRALVGPCEADAEGVALALMFPGRVAICIDDHWSLMNAVEQRLGEEWRAAMLRSGARAQTDSGRPEVSLSEANLLSDEADVPGREVDHVADRVLEFDGVEASLGGTFPDPHVDDPEKVTESLGAIGQLA